MLILASETVLKHIFCENLAVIECTLPPEIRGGGLIEKYAFGAVILDVQRGGA